MGGPLPNASAPSPETGTPRVLDAATGRREDIFFAALETTRMAMVVTDPHLSDNPIVFANHAFGAMSGYDAAETIGRNCRFMQGPDTDPMAIAALREAIERREELSIEILNYRKDGTSFWNALFVSPVFAKDGALVYFFASQIDVSRRRDTEQALRQSQRMEALGQLTGGIAHDFNNLLQVMLGHVDLLDRRLRGDVLDGQSIAAASHSIRGAIERASTLTQQLLAFARKQRLEGRQVNLNALVTASVAGAFPGHIPVELRLDPGLDDCRIDPTQFGVAFGNILVNARDAMQGEGRVAIRTSNVLVAPEDIRSFGGLEPGRYVAVSISDSGPGIPPEVVPRVMEPFFTTKEEGKGTGLGLSMVHGFVKQSGGGVQVYSEVGLGTTVQMYFPAVVGDAVRQTATVRASRGRGGAETVLVVDDRPEILDVASDLLQELGYHVISAGDGAAAIRLVESLDTDARPALLFSDVIMPGGINGYVLARTLRERMPSIRVLLTTGYAGDVLGVDGDGESEFEILKKPYKLDELAQRVRLVLDTPAGAPGTRAAR